MTEERSMSRHEWERAFEKFADISKMLQPSPSAKMAWSSNFTIALAFAHLVLQGIDCSLLASNSTSLRFCYFASLCLALWLCFVVAVNASTAVVCSAGIKCDPLSENQAHRTFYEN